jgi:transcriptional regulator with XRE-family HTH domain
LSLQLLGANLKRLREGRGYSQVELACRTGLTNSQISKIELEIGNVTLSILDALVKGLECSVQDLFVPIRGPSLEPYDLES